MKNTIFVQIASYRDPELKNTLKSLLANAKFPKNLKICIAWQHSVEDEWDTLEEYKNDPRFKIIDIDSKDSKGACWARNLIQQNYSNEKYTLQLDSHHRFIKNWDVELINMYEDLVEDGYEKPLITTYIPSYNPKNDPEERVLVPWQMNFDRFIPEGAIFFLPAAIDNFKDLKKPLPARFYSAHFAFTTGRFAIEVQHDPEYYFHGEEISIAVRAFTHGYDLFHPHKIIAWHEYTRVGRTKHWDDYEKWVELNNKSHLRNRKLFGMDEDTQDVDFGKYGFGAVRTLQDYEKYAGINFQKRAVQQYTLDKHLPPNPILKETEYEESFLPIFRHCIDLHKGHFDLNKQDYDFWAVIFEDENGNSLNREDIQLDQIKEYFKIEGEFLNVWRQFQTKIQPKKWIVWPHSSNNGWLQKIEGSL